MPDARDRGGTGRNTLGDIGHAIQSHAEAKRFSVVRDFTGHGLGQTFHCAPTVLHSAHQDGLTLEPGMIFTIEPMINAGRAETKYSVTAGPPSRATGHCRRSSNIPSASRMARRKSSPCHRPDISDHHISERSGALNDLLDLFGYPIGHDRLRQDKRPGYPFTRPCVGTPGAHAGQTP